MAIKENIDEAEDFDFDEYVFEPRLIEINGKKILDYTGIEHDKIFLVNKKDILTKKRPDWIPEFDTAGLEADQFLPVCVMDGDGSYFVQSKIKTGETEKTLNNYARTKIKVPVYETEYYKMSRDLLAASVDYYLKRKRAELKKDGSSRKVSLPRALKTMRASRYEEMVGLLGLCESYKDNAKILDLKLSHFSEAYKKQNSVIFIEQWQPLLRAIVDKRLDMNLQKQACANTFAKGEETAYGKSGASNAVYNQFGVMIKKQNGSTFNAGQRNRLENTLAAVWPYFGDLRTLAEKSELTISYADNCNQHARKAVGLYRAMPGDNGEKSIGVSFFNDERNDMNPAAVTLSHEVSHWLDSEKGKETHHFFASDAAGTLENKIAMKFKELVRDNEKKLNELSSRFTKDKTQSNLGDYWFRTCECLARAMEEHYALSQGLTIFENNPAYLPKEQFKKEIEPLAVELIEENKKHFGLGNPELKKGNSLSETRQKLRDIFVPDEARLKKFAASYKKVSEELSSVIDGAPDTFNYLRGANRAMDNKVEAYQSKVAKLSTKKRVLELDMRLLAKLPLSATEWDELERNSASVDKDSIRLLERGSFDYYASVVTSANKNAGISLPKQVPLVLDLPAGYRLDFLVKGEDGYSVGENGGWSMPLEEYEDVRAVNNSLLENLKGLPDESAREQTVAADMPVKESGVRRQPLGLNNLAVYNLFAINNESISYFKNYAGTLYDINDTEHAKLNIGSGIVDVGPAVELVFRSNPGEEYSSYRTIYGDTKNISEWIDAYLKENGIRTYYKFRQAIKGFESEHKVRLEPALNLGMGVLDFTEKISSGALGLELKHGFEKYVGESGYAAETFVSRMFKNRGLNIRGENNVAQGLSEIGKPMEDNSSMVIPQMQGQQEQASALGEFPGLLDESQWEEVYLKKFSSLELDEKLGAFKSELEKSLSEDDKVQALKNISGKINVNFETVMESISKFVSWKEVQEDIRKFAEKRPYHTYEEWKETVANRLGEPSYTGLRIAVSNDSKPWLKIERANYRNLFDGIRQDFPERDSKTFSDEELNKRFSSGDFDPLFKRLAEANYKALGTVGEMTEEEKSNEYKIIWNRLFVSGEPESVRKLRDEWNAKLLKTKTEILANKADYVESARESDEKRLLDLAKEIQTLKNDVPEFYRADIFSEKQEMSFEHAVLNCMAKESEFKSGFEPLRNFRFPEILPSFFQEFEQMREEIVMREIEKRGINISDIKENKLMENENKTSQSESAEQKPYSFFVKDSAEFDALAEFEPITGLTAKEAVSEYMNKPSSVIGVHIPTNSILNTPDGEGMWVLSRLQDGVHHLDDTFLQKGQETTRNDENFIDALSELEEECSSQGLHLSVPFVFRELQGALRDKRLEEKAAKELRPADPNWEEDKELLEEAKQLDRSSRPKTSMWGSVQSCHKLIPGVYSVSTAGHGGIMVHTSVAEKVLSKEVLDYSEKLIENGYIQFEEDCNAAIPLVDFYRKHLFEGFSWNKGREAEFYEIAQKSILRWNPGLLEKMNEGYDSSMSVSESKSSQLSLGNISLNNEHGEDGWQTQDMFIPTPEYIAAAKIDDERFAMPVATWKPAENPEITMYMTKRLIAEPSNAEKEYLDTSINGSLTVFSRKEWDFIHTQEAIELVSEQIKNQEKAQQKNTFVLEGIKAENAREGIVKPVTLDEILGVMDMKAEISENGKILVYDEQRKEYIDNGMDFEGTGNEGYEFSDANEIFERLDTYIHDYYIHDMEEQLEACGVDTEKAVSLEDFCELYKKELSNGNMELSKGELNLAMGIVHPDTVILPKKQEISASLVKIKDLLLAAIDEHGEEHIDLVENDVGQLDIMYHSDNNSFLVTATNEKLESLDKSELIKLLDSLDVGHNIPEPAAKVPERDITSLTAAEANERCQKLGYYFEYNDDEATADIFTEEGGDWIATYGAGGFGFTDDLLAEGGASRIPDEKFRDVIALADRFYHASIEEIEQAKELKDGKTPVRLLNAQELFARCPAEVIRTRTGLDVSNPEYVDLIAYASVNEKEGNESTFIAATGTDDSRHIWNLLSGTNSEGLKWVEAKFCGKYDHSSYYNYHTISNLVAASLAAGLIDKEFRLKDYDGGTNNSYTAVRNFEKEMLPKIQFHSASYNNPTHGNKISLHEGLGFDMNDDHAIWSKEERELIAGFEQPVQEVSGKKEEETVTVSLKQLYEHYARDGKEFSHVGDNNVLTDFGRIRHTDEDGNDYYDLFNEEGVLACCDGETVTLKESKDGKNYLINEQDEYPTRFILSDEEFGIATMTRTERELAASQEPARIRLERWEVGGKTYQVRECFFEHDGKSVTLYVGEEDMANGGYPDDEMEAADERIAYYVDKDKLKNLSDGELLEYIHDNIDENIYEIFKAEVSKGKDSDFIGRRFAEWANADPDDNRKLVYTVRSGGKAVASFDDSVTVSMELMTSIREATLAGIDTTEEGVVKVMLDMEPHIYERRKEELDNYLTEEKQVSENRNFVIDGASNGMLAKYINRSEISDIEEFRKFAADRITGTAQDQTYFEQMWKAGIEFCREKGWEMPEVPEEYESLLPKTAEPEKPVAKMPEISLSEKDTKLLPFSIIENIEKKRVNIKFDTMENNPDFPEIIKTLKANGWKFAPSTKQWYPVGKAVERAKDFAEEIQRRYSSSLSEPVRITKSQIEEQEQAETVSASAYDGILFFDRNYDEPKEFASYMGIDEEKASSILNALGHDYAEPNSQKIERFGLDKDKKLVSVTRKDDGTTTLRTFASQDELINYACENARKEYDGIKAMYDKHQKGSKNEQWGTMLDQLYDKALNRWAENLYQVNEIRNAREQERFAKMSLSQFDKELIDVIDGKLPKDHIFNLGIPGVILQRCGFPEGQRIEMSASRLEFKSKLNWHPFDMKDVIGLDSALQTPVAVFAYGDKEKSQNVIVGIDKEGKNFLAGVHFNQKVRGYEVSDLRTLFPKDNIDWIRWITQGKMIYGDKEKLQALIAQQRINVAEVSAQVAQSPLYEHCLESASSIMQKFGDVNDIFTEEHEFYNDIKEKGSIEQKFYTYYSSLGNMDARELSEQEAGEFYDALKSNDAEKIAEYTETDLHETSEIAKEILSEFRARAAEKNRETDPVMDMCLKNRLPYVKVIYSERSGDEYLPDGKTWTLDEADRILPELNDKFSSCLKAEVAVHFPDGDKPYTVDSDCAGIFRLDIGTDRKMESFSDLIRKTCSDKEFLDSFEKAWRKNYAPHLDDSLANDLSEKLSGITKEAGKRLASIKEQFRKQVDDDNKVHSAFIIEASESKSSKAKVAAAKGDFREFFDDTLKLMADTARKHPLYSAFEPGHDAALFTKHAIKTAMIDLYYGESREAHYGSGFDFDTWRGMIDSIPPVEAYDRLVDTNLGIGKEKEIDKLLSQKDGFEDRLKKADDKLRETPNNPLAAADKVDSTNAISAINSEIKGKIKPLPSLEVHEKIGEDSVLDSFRISDGIYQATLGQMTGNGGLAAQSYFVIDNNVAALLSGEARSLMDCHGSRFVIGNKLNEPYVLKELIEQKLMPPRDENFMASINAYIERHPVELARKGFFPVTLANIQKKTAELAVLNKSLAKDPLVLAKNIISMIDDDMKGQWLKNHGCNTPEGLRKTFSEWMSGAEIKKQKDNGYPPRGEK